MTNDWTGAALYCCGGGWGIPVFPAAAGPVAGLTTPGSCREGTSCAPVDGGMITFRDEVTEIVAEFVLEGNVVGAGGDG